MSSVAAEPLKTSPSPIATCAELSMSSASEEQKVENPGQIPTKDNKTKVINSDDLLDFTVIFNQRMLNVLPRLNQQNLLLKIVHHS